MSKLDNGRTKGYNIIMDFLSIQGYVIGIIIGVVAVQYAFALFCLLKLAYMDFDKRQYILWNIFILIVFFIGGAVFLVYYYKHPDKRVPKEPVAVQPDTQDDTQQDVAEESTAVASEREQDPEQENASEQDAKDDSDNE